MHLLTLLYLLVAAPDSSFVKIHVEFEGLQSNVLRVYIPNESFYEGFYDKNYIDLTGQKNIDVKIPLHSSSFISIKFNNEFGIPLAATINDSISIKVKRTQTSEYPDYACTFYGDNAIANTIYLNRFYPSGKNLGYFDDLPKKSKSYTEYYLASKNYIDSITSVWDSLKRTNQISNDVYKLYRAEARGALYEHAIRRMANVNRTDTTWKTYVKWLQLRKLMFHNAEAYDKLYLKTYTGVFVHNLYLDDLFTNDDAVQDSVLKKSDLGHYYYYDTLYREDAWGEDLVSSKEMFPTSISPLNAINLEAFRHYYPNSKYLKQVNKFQDSIITDRKTVNMDINIHKKEYNNLSDIFTDLQGRYFFVDVWATWCGPCLQEFNYYTALSKFLEKNNIKEVFFSVDNKSDADKWKNFIQEQHLAGEHFIINDKIQKDIINTLSEGKDKNSFTIPRYLFYDKLTNKYMIDLPRPSTGLVLQTYITNFLETNK